MVPFVPLGIALSQWDGWDKTVVQICDYVEYKIGDTGTGHICIQTAKEWELVPHPETGLWVTPESLQAKNPRMHNDPADTVVPRYTGSRGRPPQDRPR